jgi:hypothetical protein
VLLYQIFEKFLPTLCILLSLFSSPMDGLQAGKCKTELAFQVTGTRELQVSGA